MLIQMEKISPESTGTVPGLKNIKGTRQILAHGYMAVDHEIIWGIIRQGHLESLDEHVRDLLEETG